MKKNTGPIDVTDVVTNSGLHKDLRDLAREAAEYGWTCKRSGKGSVTVRSPEGDASFYIPLGTKDPGRLVKDARAALDKWITRTVQEDFAKKGITVDGVSGISPTAMCKEHGIEFMSWEGLSAHIRNEHPAPAQEEEATGLDEAIARAEEVLEDSIMDDEDVASSASVTMATSETVRPWRAILHRHTDGTVSLYESEAVLEVTTEEGVTVYRCSVEGCGYEAPLPRSVRSHYGGHVIRGDVEAVSGERVAVEVGVRDPQYQEAGRMRSALASEIYVAARSRSRHKNEALSKWCNAIAEIIEKNRGLAGQSQNTQEGGTDEAAVILGQIKELLGAPDRTEVEKLEAALDAEREKSERLRSSLRTMAALASEEME